MTQFLLCGFLGSTGANMSRVWGGTAFAQCSAAMKAPVGLLSGSAVCDSRWRGLAPTSSKNVFELLRRKKTSRGTLLM